MLWTRVGYAGGHTASPTYHDLADHTEVVEVAFDPSVLTDEALFRDFWDAHAPTHPDPSRQYRSVILATDHAQAAAAGSVKAELEAASGKPLHTPILVGHPFHVAEDYHQKFRLRRKAEVFAALADIYPAMDDLVRSTAATRLNAWAAGWLTPVQQRDVLPRTGIDLVLLGHHR